MHSLHLYCNALQGTSKLQRICRQACSEDVHHHTGVCAQDNTTDNTSASTTQWGLHQLLFHAAVNMTAQEPLDASELTETGNYQLVHKAGTGEHEGHQHFLVPQGLHSLLGLIWPNSPAIQHLQPWQVGHNVCPAMLSCTKNLHASHAGLPKFKLSFHAFVKGFSVRLMDMRTSIMQCGDADYFD